MTVSNGPSEFNGVYHKLTSLKNNHYQWESRFAGHLGDYVLYFDSTTENTWVIKGNSGSVILKNLEHFFEPLTNVAQATHGGQNYSNLRIECLDTKVGFSLNYQNTFLLNF